MNDTIFSLIPLNIDGREYSAIPSGLSSRIFRSVDIGALQSEPGWFFDAEGRMEPWTLEGVRENEQGMLFYGPDLDCRPFDPDNLNMKDLKALIAVFTALREKNLGYDGFFAPAWQFCADGRILLLPPSLMEFIRKSSPEGIRRDHLQPYNHPDLSGSDGLEFTAAVLACLALKAPHPYAPLEEAEDNRNEQLRRPPLLPPEILIPGLNEESAGLIAESLKKESRANIKDWNRLLDSWLQSSPVRELKDEEKSELKGKADELLNRGEKNRKLRQNWRRKNTVYIAIAGAVLALGLFISAPVKKALEPPTTMGLSARQVVEGYYGGFNSLDQELMEDCIAKELGKGDIGEVTNIYVTSRVRMGYEGKSGVLSAADWDAQGRPELEPGMHLYGAADLKIEDLGGGKFRVNYEKWMPGSNDDPSSDAVPPPMGYRISDLITLEEQRKGNWLITARDRTMKELD